MRSSRKKSMRRNWIMERIKYCMLNPLAFLNIHELTTTSSFVDVVVVIVIKIAGIFTKATGSSYSKPYKNSK